MNKFDYKNLTPFKWFVLENFPFIEADFDALTEWQLFCKLGKEMNKIIDSQNVVGTEMEKFSQAFIELKNFVDNYFENLDVQDEINNKLNEMTEDGTLQNILMNYVNVEKIYNTHQEMIEDTKLVNYMKVKTLGYYTINDGGGAEYYITDKLDETKYQEKVNGLYAELIIKNNTINVNQVGAYGDGVHDDTSAIQNILNLVSKYNYQPSIKLLDKVYCVTNIILNPKNKLIGSGFENTKLLAMDYSSGNIISITEDAWNYCTLSDMTISCKSSNNTIENAILISVDNAHYDSYSLFKNLRIYYIPNGNGIWNKTGGRECRFDNIIIKECGGYGLIAGSSDCLYYNITSSWNKKAGIWDSGSNNRFVNNKCHSNGYNNDSENRYELCGFFCTGGISTFTACDAQENYGDGFYVGYKNNSFINCKADANGIKITSGLDKDLFYSGFYVSPSYTHTVISDCQFIIMCDDFRRSSGRQVQKYGIDLEYLQHSNVIITSRNQVQDIYYGSGFAINNSNFGNNFIVLNGNYYGNMLTNGITLSKLNDYMPKVDFYDDNNDIFSLILNNHKLQLDFYKNHTYSNSPIVITGGKDNDGSIKANNNYSLELACRKLSFFDGTPYQKQTANNDATDLNSAISLVNNLKKILKNYGLIN